jgi:SNF2 family DNA or RNA helicase
LGHQLRSYQIHGIAHIVRSFVQLWLVALFDDTSLGKTLQMIKGLEFATEFFYETMQPDAKELPCLVLVPNVEIAQKWIAEIVSCTVQNKMLGHWHQLQLQFDPNDQQFARPDIPSILDRPRRG